MTVNSTLLMVLQQYSQKTISVTLFCKFNVHSDDCYLKLINVARLCIGFKTCSQYLSIIIDIGAKDEANHVCSC